MNPDAKKTLRRLLIAVPCMFAFGFALVPLYDVFCEVTGINGKVFQSASSYLKSVTKVLILVTDPTDNFIKESLKSTNFKFTLEVYYIPV